MRVVLDTNVIRDLGAGDLPSTVLRAATQSGLRVHLSDTAGSELVHQLVTGQFSWEHWIRARTLLIEALDPEEPILLGGRLGLLRAGLRPRTEQGSPLEIAAAVDAYRAGWSLLRHATSADAITSIADPSSGYRFDRTSVLSRLSQEKDKWVREFGDFRSFMIAGLPDIALALPARQDSPEALASLTKILQEGLDRDCHPSDPPPSVRLDALLRVHALLRLRYLRQKDTYNPTKDANDSLDQLLLQYLAHPVAVCTSDGGLATDARTSLSWQTKWIVSPRSLETPSVLAELRELRWPQRAA